MITRFRGFNNTNICGLKYLRRNIDNMFAAVNFKKLLGYNPRNSNTKNYDRKQRNKDPASAWNKDRLYP